MVDFTEILVQIITGTFSLIGITATFYYTKKMKKYEQEQKTCETYPPLTTHPVHVNIDEHIMSSRQLLNEYTVNEGRRKLALDFMKYAITCWREPCERFANEAQNCIDNCDTNCYECNRIYTLAMKMFSEGRIAVEQLSNWNIDPEDYEAVVIFRDKFVEWDRLRLERLARKISDIALIHDTYKNCSSKSARILEAIDDYISDMNVDGKYVLAKLNGELNGKHYKYYEL